MLNKYTEGPWKLIPCQCGECSNYNVNPVVMCQCGSMTKANAQLIASAPELLEALKAITTGILTEREIKFTAEQAIQKAEGKL